MRRRKLAVFMECPEGHTYGQGIIVWGLGI